MVVALNEYTNRTAAFQNVSKESSPTTAMGELDKIYHAPLHNPQQYDKNFEIVAAKDNISADADTVLVPEPKDIRLLINQHNMQTTSVVGGLHGIFNQTEEQKLDAMMRTHPASSTLTENMQHSYVGDTEYLTLKNLQDAQSNIVGGVDPDATNSNFPEMGNKELLDTQGLSSHFPRGLDSSASIGSKF